VYDEVIKHVLHGATLADAFVNVCPTIDPFFIACVRVGERSGSLSENLSYVSQELKKREMLKKKIIGALVYPSFIIVASVCIGGLITAYIFPKIIPIFQSLNIALPLTTRVLLVLSVALTHHGFLIVFGFGAGVVIMVYVFKRSAPMRNFIVKLFLRLPFVGDFLRSRMMSTFTRMYGLLLKSGLSVVESVSIIKETFTNSFVREECEKLRQSVIQGEGIATHLKKTPSIFPFFVADMVGVGERSGSLSEMFLLLSNHFADEVEERIRIFSSLVEPVLMVGMGLAVGFLAISVITPLYQITEHLNG
jgi:type II secretory pathway component PulF